ncbi:MAG: caspase family protein [Clostridia bacterium]|nr:caspase family protein [Clostridia bacterium]
MLRKVLRALIVSLGLCFLCLNAGAEGLNRALLVGCDHFISRESTAPASAGNVTRMAEALSGGSMNLETLITRKGDVNSVAELEGLIRAAFADADEQDVSYFYISTHGEWEQGMAAGDMTLLLSDGNHEEGVTAAQLRAIFDTIPGVKVLILDACHSGAVIGKGVHPPFENVFAGENYKVLCSSGGAEESWFWQAGEDEDMAVGAGYFSSALESALSVRGGYGADDNRDGVITLTELKRYLLANHGASTVRCYPEEDDFAVMRYDAEAYTGRRRDSVMENVSFESDVLTAQEPEAAFSFNMVRPAQVAYQIVYQEDGRWDFDRSEVIYDNEERYGSYGDAQGYLSPGMKQRALRLALTEEGSYGYILMQLITTTRGVPSLSASRVICVPPQSGDPHLTVTSAGAFAPLKGEELGIMISHEYPCQLTVTVQTMEGKTVRRLASRDATRPEQLQPRGSTFCWSGRRANGQMAEPGTYRISVKAYVGDETYECVSEPFELRTE